MYCTPRPTAPCFSGSLFREHSPKPLSAGSDQPGALRLTWFCLTAEVRRGNRRVAQSYRSLRHSAVKSTQRIYSRAKCFGYTRGVKICPLTQAAVFPRLQVLLHQRRFGEPRSASCTGSCHMKICLGQRSSYGKYEARCGWSGGYFTSTLRKHSMNVFQNLINAFDRKPIVFQAG